MIHAEAAHRIQELSQQLNHHNQLYYQESRTEISDYDFDQLLEELIHLEKAFPDLLQQDSPSQRVGGTITKEFQTVAHESRMLSLGNTYSREELNDFDERVHKALVGEVDQGWTAAIGTLMNERVSIGAGGGGLGRGTGTVQFDRLAELATHTGAITDPVTRNELATIWVKERTLAILGDRMRASLKSGNAPGPEGSIAKLAGSELGSRVADMAMDLLAE